MTSRNLLIGAIVIGFGLAAPFVGLYPVLLMKLLCFALFACAFNLLIGFVGLLSFGHAMFFGSAAYAAGHAMKVWGFTPELGLIFGVAVSALLGVLVGALAIRRQGIYFAMITMALAQAFGINVPLLVTLTFAFGVALAGLAGVLAASAVQITPLMGSNIIIVVFAVVVIGGMGSILGAIVTGLSLGVIEGLTRVYYPEGSATVVFVIMAIVLLIRPAGLFGRA